MKGDVGMSLHEKEGNKKNLQQADNPSLHLCFKKWFALFGIGSERQDLLQNNGMPFVQEQRCRDGLSAWCRFFLVSSFSRSDIPTSPFISLK